MQNYGTIDDVRKETGLLGDPSVPDDIIQSYLTQSTGIVLSYCSSVYDVSTIKPSVINNSDSPAYNHLRRCETLMASGYLLIKLYGGDISGDKNGYDKVDESKDLLGMVQSGEVLLIDENGEEYGKAIKKDDVSKSYGLSGNTSTTPKFTVSDSY